MFEVEEQGMNIDAVAAVVRDVTYKPGWRLEVRASVLDVTMPVVDSVTGARVMLTHRIPIPVSLPLHRFPHELRRWLLERLFDIEKHEAMEFFRIGGAAPFWPDHERPYEVREKPREEWREVSPLPDPYLSDALHDPLAGARLRG